VMDLDPRLHAFRADLADSVLRDHVKASRYVDASIRQSLSGVLPLYCAPSHDAQQSSQIRYGEFLDVFEDNGEGFLWVQNRSDRYVGYVPSSGKFGESIAMMSNRITALKAHVYPKPHVRATPIDELTLGSYVSVCGKHNRWLELTSGGFVFETNVMATEFANTPDYVFTAGRMLHTPYLWGGRTPKGIDCSGLVQLSLEMAGIDFPRDSDQQREAFAEPLDCHWKDRNWKRGDIVFFLPNPHVGIMTGTDHMIHASGHVMEVTVEPLADFISRGNEVVAVAKAEKLIFS